MRSFLALCTTPVIATGTAALSKRARGLAILKWLLAPLSVTIVVAACSSPTNVDSSVTNLSNLHRQYLALKQQWLASDDRAIQTLCKVATNTNRQNLASAAAAWGKAVAADPSDANIDAQTRSRARIDALDARVKACASLQDPQALIEHLETAAAAGSDLRTWDSAEYQASTLLNQSTALSDWLPVSGAAGLDYSGQTLSDRDATRADLSRNVASLAGKAVAEARSASGTALAVAGRAEHQLDKQSAEQSDQEYSAASNALNGLSATGNPLSIFSSADVVFASADMSVLYAQSSISGKALPGDVPAATR